MGVLFQGKKQILTSDYGTGLTPKQKKALGFALDPGISDSQNASGTPGEDLEGPVLGGNGADNAVPLSLVLNSLRIVFSFFIILDRYFSSTSFHFSNGHPLYFGVNILPCNGHPHSEQCSVHFLCSIIELLEGHCSHIAYLSTASCCCA